MSQRLDVPVRDAAEAEPVGDVVHVAQEPGKAVGERAVEIEDDEGVGHDVGRKHNSMRGRNRRWASQRNVTAICARWEGDGLRFADRPLRAAAPSDFTKIRIM